MEFHAPMNTRAPKTVIDDFFLPPSNLPIFFGKGGRVEGKLVSSVRGKVFLMVLGRVGQF